MGRPAVFTPKDPACRFQGLTTKKGARAFEAKRKELSEISGIKNPSDGDVFEYLAIGEEATRLHLTRARK